jgi:uncharacterized protein YkwD
LKLRNLTSSIRTLSVAVGLMLAASTANAQQVVRADDATATPMQPASIITKPSNPTVAQPTPAAQPVEIAQPVYVAPAGDPYGFVAWLNATRAQYGLGAVGYDPNLTNWAAMNNNQQVSRGIGHYVMGPARRQNSAMGNYASIGAMWMSSPGHRAALLDPTISFVGIAGAGAYWTFNAY